MHVSICHAKKIILSTSLGGLLEMYDFIVYAFLAPTIQQLFFSFTSERIGLILTFFSFAMGYLVRPLGGIIFGHINDKIGRKRGLLLTVLLMGCTTAAMGFLPTAAQIGPAAGLLLLALRLLQGLSIGGELPGAMTYLSETSDLKSSRYVAYLFAAINCGGLLASCLIITLKHTLTPAEFFNWGWRLAFWLSFLFTIVGLISRMRLHETEAFQNIKKQYAFKKFPLITLFKSNRKLLKKAMLLLIPFMLVISQMFVFTPSFLTLFCHYTHNQALLINTIALLFFILSLVGFGLLQDRLKIRKCVKINALSLIVAGAIYYALLSTPLWLLGCAFFAVVAAYVSVEILGQFIVLFPTDIRCTGIAVSYNGVFMLGGFIPALLTVLIPAGRSPFMMPCVLFIGLISWSLYALVKQARVERATIAKQLCL